MSCSGSGIFDEMKALSSTGSVSTLKELQYLVQDKEE